MDVVCGWVLWKGQEHPQGCSPCQALIRGAVKSPLFVQAPVISCTSWRLQPSSHTVQAQGQGCVCLVFTILHTHKRQGLTNNTQKKREAGSLGRALEPTPPGTPPIISLIAWGRLLNQLNFASLIGPVTASWLVSEEGKRCIYSPWAAHGRCSVSGSCQLGVISLESSPVH